MANIKKLKENTVKLVKLEDVCYNGSSSLSQKDIIMLEGKYPVYGASGLIKYINFYKYDKEYIAIVKDGAGIGRTMILPANSSVISTLQYIFPKENINIRYLYYALNAMDLSKYYSGVTIPHIYFKDYKKEELYLPIIDEQINIVNKLDKIREIIDIRKKQIEELDEIIKSQFVEMFGDVRKNDKNWKYTTLGKECFLNPKKSELKNMNENFEVSFVAMPSVSENGNIDTNIIKKYDDVKKGFTYFAENDVLFAKITPCMENGKGAVAVGLKNKIGFGSTEFHVLRPKENINSVWLYTLTAMKSFRIEAERKMTGSAGQKRVPISFFKTYNLGLPPITLQNQFADIVKQIDKQKFEIQKSLEETQKLQESLMNKYFG